MKFTWIYIFLTFTVVSTTCAPVSEESSPTLDKVEGDEERQETLEDLVDLGNEETDLPILPPIILIDFTNGTNLTSEEKSKRTINGNLGYGFQSNNLFSGKYNYYFPAGKTGTTVSIEESISPFLPTTIIEKLDPNGNPYSSTAITNNVFPSKLNANGQSPRPLVFGQRTKLQKTNSDNFQSFSKFVPAQSPNYATYSTPRPDYRSNSYSSGLGSYANPTSTFVYESYSTPRPPVYNPPLQGQYNSPSSYKTYNSPVQSYEGFSTSRPASPNYNSPSSGFNAGSYKNQAVGLQTHSTPKPQNYNPSQSQTTVLSPLSNSPKYSYENGVKYEHKIVWKYPDGAVSDVAPNNYDNSYAEYSTPTKISLTSNYQNPAVSQNNFPKAISSGFSVNSGSIYSQKPATFPENDAAGNEQSKPNQFVSSASISNAGTYSASSATPPSQKYSFQNPYSTIGNSQLTKAQSGSSSTSTSYKTNFSKANVKDEKIVSTYPVNSPEAEYSSLGSYPQVESYTGQDSPQVSDYTYGDQSSSISSAGYSQPSGSSSDSANGKIQSTILTKYTPQVQSYLKKALGIGASSQSQEYEEPSNAADSYSNIQYSNLLDYNPSISQYVRDPSSILNAQPTFVQAGNSLIPVIILRVDGVAPIQPKVTPNINLKALLQRYLTQYAQTVNDLSQGKDFDKSYGNSRAQSNSASKLSDLTQLTESLGQLGHGSNFKQNFDQSFAQQFTQDYEPSSYSNADDHREYLPQVSRETLRKPKVKSVEIIDDPRFTSAKLKH